MQKSIHNLLGFYKNTPSFYQEYLFLTTFTTTKGYSSRFSYLGIVYLNTNMLGVFVVFSR